jgi:hypothetical protein
MGSIPIMQAKLSNQDLIYGWQVKEKHAVEDEWLPVAKVPTVVHLDLMDNNK